VVAARACFRSTASRSPFWRPRVRNVPASTPFLPASSRCGTESSSVFGRSRVRLTT
jgi:hypothetical protein